MPVGNDQNDNRKNFRHVMHLRIQVICPARVAMVLYDEDDELRHRIQCQESIVVISRTKAI